jgi:hypothetical protein
MDMWLSIPFYITEDRHLSYKKKYRETFEMKLNDGSSLSNCYDVSRWLTFLEQLKVKLIGVINNLTKKQQENREFVVELNQDAENITRAIDNIKMNTDDWIVANIKTEGTEVIRAILKPLNAAPFCSSLFKKCGITLIMSLLPS